MHAAFCTSSTDRRLVTTTKPPFAASPARASAPASLSRALWRPTSSRSAISAPVGVAERGGVHRAGLAVERLRRGHGVERGEDRGGRRCRVRHDLRWRTHGFGQRFDAAKAAADGSGEVAPPFGERGGARIGKAHAHLDAEVLGYDLERSDLVRSRDDPFGEAEADARNPRGRAGSPSSRRRTSRRR